MSVESRLTELGITLPPAGTPSHAYVPVQQTGNLLFVSGNGPKKDGNYEFLGKLGGEVTLEQGQESARWCILNCLASVKRYLGDLDRVVGVIKVVGFVASVPTFTKQPQVMNAASDLLVAIFGDRGAHARTSVGVAALPGDIPVEIEMILEISPASAPQERG